ncbi:MAG: IgGFc-binding protein [Polyangiales bacterium]
MIRPALASALLVAACSNAPPPIVKDDDGGAPRDDLGDVGLPGQDAGPTRCTPGQILCSGNTQYTCDADGQPVGQRDCASGTTCFTGVGCRVCMPGLSRCATTPGMEQQTETCAMDGSRWTPGVACSGAEGLTCVGGRCVSRCDQAALGRSYLGCEYWATVTANSQLAASFQFAVVLSNPNAYAVTASISGGALPAARAVNLAPGAVQTEILPWVQELLQNDPTFPGCRGPGDPTCRGGSPARSALRRNGAYRIRANGPIAAYQFNPLTYQSPQGYASFTNDASLLLPQGVLTTRYTVSTMPNWAARTTTGTVYLGGFASVVATTGESTTVTVRPTAQIAVGTGVTPVAPGATATFTLQQGDVLQLVGTGAGDLTGTTITSNLPVAVFVGHDCTNVPVARPACDHLEEQLFPNETWGRDYVVSALRDRGTNPSVVRIVSQADGNRITYDPPSARPAETLNAGQMVEFATNVPFRATGTRAFLVAQYMIGQGNFDPTNPGAGDPAMVLEVPVQQYRTSYDFLVPSTYPQNFVNVVAPTGAALTLDNTPLRGSSMDVSGYTVYTLPIPSGAHRVTSAGGQQFGIKVYGIAPYTSYMYPGGLDLQIITPG